MKTTLDLPDELVREVKLRAVVLGRTVKDLVAEFLRQGLGMAAPNAEKKASESSMVSVGRDGLPVVRCSPDAPATRLTAGHLLKMEQETQGEEDTQRAGLSL